MWTNLDPVDLFGNAYGYTTTLNRVAEWLNEEDYAKHLTNNSVPEVLAHHIFKKMWTVRTEAIDGHCHHTYYSHWKEVLKEMKAHLYLVEDMTEFLADIKEEKPMIKHVDLSPQNFWKPGKTP